MEVPKENLFNKVAGKIESGLWKAVDYIHAATREDIDDAYKLGAYRIKKPSQENLQKWKAEVDGTLEILRKNKSVNQDERF